MTNDEKAPNDVDIMAIVRMRASDDAVEPGLDKDAEKGETRPAKEEQEVTEARKVPTKEEQEVAKADPKIASMTIGVGAIPASTGVSKDDLARKRIAAAYATANEDATNGDNPSTASGRIAALYASTNEKSSDKEPSKPTIPAARSDPAVPAVGLTRQQAVEMEMEPGAYAVATGVGRHQQPHLATTNNASANNTRRDSTETSDPGLVAVPVEEEPVLDLGAEEVDQEEAQRRESKKEENRRRELMKLGCGALILIAVVTAIALAVSLGGSKENPSSPTPSPSFAPLPETGSPTNSPTSVLDSLLGSLPSYSLESLKASSSPQWKAMEWLTDHPDLTNMAEWRQTQLFALATFYYAMEGDTWPEDIKDNWLLYDKSECFWFSGLFGSIGEDGSYELDETAVEYTSFASEGVGPPCNEDGRFQTLIMFGLELNESKPVVPPEIALLTYLSALSLQLNKINASITEFMPSEFYHMENLSFFKFFDNHLTGGVPSELGLMTSMTHLDVGLNALGGNIPSELGALTMTTELHLYDNGLIGSIPSTLGLMTHMKEATMHRNTLTGPVPSEFGSMIEIERLYLSTNRLTGLVPSQLGLMAGLVDFAMVSNLLSGSLPSELAMMTNLQLLRLNNNTLSGAIPPTFQNFVVNGSLGLLVLENNALTGVVPEGLCVLGQSFLKFDCGNELCGCCWCPCPGDNSTVECSTDLSLNPLLAKNEWPGRFPGPSNMFNTVTVNIFTDDWQSETSWTWSLLDESGTWQTLDSGNPDSLNSSSLHSYTQEVQSDALYRLSLFDSYGDGTCCSWGFGWFSITNSIPSSTHANGTVVWTAVGDALDGGSGELSFIEEGTRLDVFLWIDSNGNARHVEYIPDQGYALAGASEENDPVVVVASVGAVATNDTGLP